MRRRGAVALCAAASVAISVLVPAAPAAADPVRDLQYWLDEYGISEAWQTTRGAGVTVAVIDTGIDASHPDLAGAVVGGTDVSGLGSPDGLRPIGEPGEDSHGTLVASLVAGRGHAPGDGVIGVAPAASLLSVSVGFGLGDVPSDDQIAQAVRWSVDNGADVINMSLTRNTLDWPESWDDAFLYAMENDVVVVAAAGNRGSGTTTVGAPATMPGVLTVAGVDRDEQASFDASSQGITISVAAPSEELVGALPGGGYARWEGTSGAAPLVSGVVALVRAAHPELDAANVIQRVLATAHPVGEPVPGPIYGYGIVDAAAAVTADVARVDANPMGDLAEWVRLYRRANVPSVPETSTAPLPPEERTDAEDPQAAADPIGVLYPGVEQLRTLGLPLGVVVAFLGGALWIIVAGLRPRTTATGARGRRARE
ncbi:S8 family peptidase [Herbiconiux sp. SYSU D00978]|uniref:S8 family peptidase n=1 Tax=Herbiconiux sp. SYSU D00978 TaxID=2812562 RepID=UPI0027DC66A5|nr:S8 family serine peptidase [Herbiconiux sp. SYSU D00978]